MARTSESSESASEPTTDGPLVTVYVTLKTGTSVRGVLLERADVALILRAAQVAGTDGNSSRVKWTKLDGDVVIPMANVDYWQQSLDVMEGI